MELTHADALTIAAAVRAGTVSAVEVATAHLDRSERLGRVVGAFARLTPEIALAQAAAVDEAVARGEASAPLLGVPCPIKDLVPVAGLGHEAGSAALVGNVAAVDDDIVGWLRSAGTVMTGKTSTPEFGLPCYTEPDAGPARTPWDLTRSAGGSSGGAAAAVATGLAPIAQASDGGGSIRIPASACGLVGLKASRGRISVGRWREPGPGLVSDGVLSRTVADTAVALDVLAGHGVGETYHQVSAPRGSFLEACRREPDRLRIGLLTTPVIAEADVHPECLEAARVTAEALAGLGHEVGEAPVPFGVERWLAFGALWSVGSASIPLPPEAEPLLRPLTRWLRERGRATSGVEYAAALGAVQRLTVDTALAWDGFDVILTPTLAQPPSLVGELRDDDDPAGDFAAQTRFTPWTSVYNLTGRPAISLPLHTAELGGRLLPIGVMLGGRLGAEETLLRVSAQLEDSVGWRHPFLAADPD